MSVQATRAVLRQSRFVTRRAGVRYASSTSETASKATEAASSAASKASQGLSRVTSSAGPAISSAAQNVGGALRKIGGRTGNLIAFVDCKCILRLLIPFVYTFLVFGDLLLAERRRQLRRLVWLLDAVLCLQSFHCNMMLRLTHDLRHSINTSHCLLLQGRPRIGKAGVPRPEHDTAVSTPTQSEIPCEA